MYVNLKINIKNSMKEYSHINIVLKFLTKRKKLLNCSVHKKYYKIILTWWTAMDFFYVINYVGHVAFIDLPGVLTVPPVITVLKGLIIIVHGLELVLGREITTFFLFLSPLLFLSLFSNYLVLSTI